MVSRQRARRQSQRSVFLTDFTTQDTVKADPRRSQRSSHILHHEGQNRSADLNTGLAVQLLAAFSDPEGAEQSPPSQQPYQWLTPSTHEQKTGRGERATFSLPFDSQRQHELFHSLFKVLFSFRSHYLFAIELLTIFSLRRSTSAGLHSTLKLCDLWNKEGYRSRNGRHERDDSPLWWYFSERFFCRAQTYQPGPCTTIPRFLIPFIVDYRVGCRSPSSLAVTMGMTVVVFSWP